MSHINKIEVIQGKILRTIVNVPWYVRNDDIRRDLRIVHLSYPYKTKGAFRTS